MRKPREPKNVGRKSVFQERHLTTEVLRYVESQDWAGLRIPDAPVSMQMRDSEKRTRFTLPKPYDLSFTAPSSLIKNCSESHAIELKLVKDSYTFSVSGSALERLRDHQLPELLRLDRQGANAYGWVGVNFRQHGKAMSQQAIERFGLRLNRLWFVRARLVADELALRTSIPLDWWRANGIECLPVKVLRESPKTPGKLNKLDAWDLTPLLGGGRRPTVNRVAPKLATPLAHLDRKLTSALAPGQGNLFDINNDGGKPQ